MHQATVLIVEDDPIAAALLAGWARSLGSRVLSAGGTGEADAILAVQAVDLLLCDVHLPGNDGLGWVEAVLARPLPPPLVLITGNPELATTLRAANLPIAGYLVKPPDFKALTALAQRLVTEHRRRRDLRVLSAEASRLLDHPSLSADPLRDRLLQLSRWLTIEADRSPREAAGAAGWHSALRDTIATLERTKDSFRSKDLGNLRRRLLAFLSDEAAA